MVKQSRSVPKKDAKLQALSAIRVLEVAQWAAAPAAGAILADFGADVIHVEHPIRGDGARGVVSIRAEAPFNYGWEQDNHNKRSIGIDISTESGRGIIYELVKRSDVFLANLRPHEVRRYALEYRKLSKLNHGLIYAIVTGYGRRGPDSGLPGYDYSAFWARSGIMATLPQPGTPLPFARPGIGDNTAAVVMAGAISLALLVRERTGIGQEVDISLLGTGIWVLNRDIDASLITKRPTTQMNRGNVPNPLLNYYRCRDDKYIMLVNLQPDPYWAGFCKAIEQESIEHDERFNSIEKRRKNNTTLISIIDEAFARKTYGQMSRRLRKYGIIWAPVQDTAEVAADRQARANGCFARFNHPKYGPIELVMNPWKLSKTPASIRAPAPEFGQHTEEILLELGYTWEDIVKLKDRRIIN